MSKCSLVSCLGLTCTVAKQSYPLNSCPGLNTPKRTHHYGFKYLCALYTCHAQVTAAEGFGKTRLFEILDDLEVKTRPIMEEARQRLAREKGEAALQPHNISHALAGT